jgi:superoxide reductase
MTPEHYIEWIEVITAHRIYKKFLNPDPLRPDQAIAIFDIEAEIISARAYCNLHGLRKN